MDSLSKISVIIPVFNAELSLPELNERLILSFQKSKIPFEIIYIDDGSVDSSWNVLEQLHENCQNLKVVRLAKNFGQHNAIVCGIIESEGDVVVTMDDDLEHSPEQILGLVDTMQKNNYELLYAIPEKSQKKGFKKWGSSFWKKWMGKMGKGVGDGSSFRVIDKKLAKVVEQHKESFIFIDEIFNWHTDAIGLKKIPFEVRKHGKSNYTNRSLFKFQFDILMIYSRIPMRVMILFGSVIGFFSFLLGVYFLVLKFIYNVAPGFTATIVVLLFSTSVILISIGYMGEYLHKIFRILNNEPQFSIKEKKNANKKIRN